MQPSRARLFTGVVLFLATLLIVVSRPLTAAGRNVVLIVADDHGRDAGCYQNPVLKTPHLDRLAREGTRFDFAFCTTASCSPSRSVILTGLQNHANGQYGLQHAYHKFSTKPAVRSLPVLLKAAGYRTARIGKLHVEPDEVYRFDTVLEANARNGVAMANACRELIAQKSEQPFFLYFCPADAHRSGNVREESPERPDAFGNRRYPGVEEVCYEPKDVLVPPFLPDSPECRAELAEYYQSVSRLDQGVGRLLGVLEECGRLEDTLVVYLSDNGAPFPGAKTTLYEPGVRLPLLVRSPDAKKRGVVSRAMVTWADITPTVLDFAGALTAGGPAAAGRFHGRSFLAVIEEENPAGWDEVYASHTFHEVTMYYPMRSVRDRRFKCILNIASGLSFPFASDLHGSATWQGVLRRGNAAYGKRSVEAYHRRPQFELYDLEADPHEVHNLAGSPEHAEVFAALQAKLRAWQERTGDPWVVKYRHE
jgi:N-sulfoglucosamine sulfohydrolase